MMKRKLALDWRGSEEKGFVADTPLGKATVYRVNKKGEYNLSYPGVYDGGYIGHSFGAKLAVENALLVRARQLIEQLTPKEPEHGE